MAIKIRIDHGVRMRIKITPPPPRIDHGMRMRIDDETRMTNSSRI